jgi:hypothetical protein
MQQTNNKLADNSKLSKGTKFLNVTSGLVFLIGVASLVNHLMYFYTTLTQYVAQGYEQSEILKSLIPGQLLPGVFEAVALYMGIAAALFGLGMVNQKLSIQSVPLSASDQEGVLAETAIDQETASISNLEGSEETV